MGLERYWSKDTKFHKEGISSNDQVHNMVTIINNNALYSQKLVRVDLTVIIIKNKFVR
jgi:hypothetical protein